MASYVVSTMKKISFAPATVAEEVVQNVRTIIATQVGTVPLFRDFGVSWEGVDRPFPVARALVRSAVIDAVQRFEPRARVDAVEWEEGAGDTMDGLMHPVVTVSLADGVENAPAQAADGVTISAVYREADRCLKFAVDIAMLEQSIAARIVELELTDYVRIFDLASASQSDDGSTLKAAVGVAAVSGRALFDTVAMMIDTANTVAAQVTADVQYYSKILHEFERIEYDTIYAAGEVTHDPFAVSKVEPVPVASVTGVTDLDELSALAASSYAAAVAARDALLGLERLLGEFEHTAYTSIYESQE